MELIISSCNKQVKTVSSKILEVLNGKGVDETFLFDLRLACEKALINAVKHGNKSDPQKTVTVRYEIIPEGVTISIIDQGEGFDYESVPDPRTVKNLLRAGGRGLFLIRKLMDKVEFNDSGNQITMTKLFPKK